MGFYSLIIFSPFWFIFLIFLHLIVFESNWKDVSTRSLWKSWHLRGWKKKLNLKLLISLAYILSLQLLSHARFPSQIAIFTRGNIENLRWCYWISKRNFLEPSVAQMHNFKLLWPWQLFLHFDRILLGCLVKVDFWVNSRWIRKNSGPISGVNSW